jgi:hypothetical protein
MDGKTTLPNIVSVFGPPFTPYPPLSVVSTKERHFFNKSQYGMMQTQYEMLLLS